MPRKKPPIEPEAFPLEIEGKKIKGKRGKTIAITESDTATADIAERLNEDEERKEEDRWSA
jgi:hypothetical protein